MIRERDLLVLDGLGNIGLGALILVAPIRLASWLGIIDTEGRFYPSLFGAVLFGIGVALLTESRRHEAKTKGLGLGGALIVNTCFGLVLAAWLLLGGVNLPRHGTVVLWGLVAVLLGLSGVEWAAERRRQAS